jgi:outer membrane protein OmpA-like peptidoglycan-associated protein
MSVVLTSCSDGDTDGKCGKRTKDGEFCVPDNPFDSLAIVVGNTQNSPAVDLDTLGVEFQEYIEDVAWNALSGNGSNKVSLIEASSKPEVTTFEFEKRAAKNAANNINKIKQDVKKLNEQVQKIRPSINGADYFEATAKAVKAVSKGSSPLVIVMGSGLSDTGLLNFAEDNFINKDNQVAVDAVMKSKDVSELSMKNTTIVLHGLGQTVKPQEVLDTNTQEKINKIYEQVFKHFSADVEIDQGAIKSGAKSVDTEFQVNPTPLNMICDPLTFQFYEDKLKFKPDSAQFVDEKLAKENLMAIATILKDNSHGRTAKIIGTQAIPEGQAAQDGSELTDQRANAVLNILVGLGVPQDELSARGAGSKFDGHIDEKVDGKWSEERASQNRRVMITVQDKCDAKN